MTTAFRAFAVIAALIASGAAWAGTTHDMHGQGAMEMDTRDTESKGMGGMDMGGMCPMMGPGMQKGMHKGRGEMGGGKMMGMGAPIEERLATLKTKLAITDAQIAAWDGYANAVKARAGTMKTNHETMMKAMQSGTVVTRLETHIAAMSSMLDVMKTTLKPATEALYGTLSDDQKKQADQILGAGGCMM